MITQEETEELICELKKGVGPIKRRRESQGNNGGRKRRDSRMGK